jgi:hypothetical protein
MPLSAEEQRILQQIEQSLETDERFANSVKPSGIYAHSARKAWWAGLGAIASLIFTVIALQVHFLVAFAGFLAMLGCVLIIEKQLRAMSKVGLKDVAASLRKARTNAASSRIKFGKDI